MDGAGRRGGRRRALPARPLTPRDVVRAALEVLDRRGLAGFTMRAVADRLGAYPATVYWHVGNRERLLAAMVDHALAGIDLPDPRGTPWQEWLAALAREYRRAMRRHPVLAGLAASQLLVGPPTLRLVETLLEVLAGAGFAGAALARAYNAYVGSVVGWVAVEMCSPPADADEGWQRDFEQTVRSLPASEYPVIAANLGHLAGSAVALRWEGGADRPMDAAFEAALRVWLAGLEALRGEAGGRA